MHTLEIVLKLSSADLISMWFHSAKIAAQEDEEELRKLEEEERRQRLRKEAKKRKLSR